MSLVSIGDADIYTEIHGTGEPVLLVTGIGGTCQFWAQQVAALRDHYRVVVHDHRGIGRSSPTSVVSTAGVMADDLLALMDALEIEQAHLVGHSTGGAIGQHIALRAPERLKSLVMSASWAGPTPLFTETFRVRRDVLINAGVRDYLLVSILLAAPAWWIGEAFGSADEFLGPRLASFPGVETEVARLNAVASHDLRDRVADIQVPTTVICARDDQLTPPAMSEELARLIPGARLIALERGGHFCLTTAAAEYNDALLEALENQR
jgi:aminoacrylate hydrolase